MILRKVVDRSNWEKDKKGLPFGKSGRAVLLDQRPYIDIFNNLPSMHYSKIEYRRNCKK